MTVLGIDLGRAGCAAYVDEGDEEASFSICVEPLVVLTPSNEWLVGEEARRAAAAGAGEAVWDLLELLGRKLRDLAATQLASWTFRLVPGFGDKALVEFQPKSTNIQQTFAPEQLVAVLFARLRQLAEEQVGHLIADASLTIPASFNHTQRQALRDACVMAGMTPRRLVVSSTAAGVASLVERGAQATGEILLVLDSGAGSTDISILSMPTLKRVEVAAIAGDTSIGGFTLTERIVGHFLRSCSVQAATATPFTLNRLRRGAQLAKKILSRSATASVEVQLDTGPFSASITRVEFETACSDCWDRIVGLIKCAMDEGGVTNEQITRVLMCGGSVVIPALQQLVANLFPTTCLVINGAEKLQSRGAAMLIPPTSDVSRQISFVDVLPLAFGVQQTGTEDTVVAIPANTRIPAHGENLFFAACQDAGVSYRILEGRDLHPAARSPHLRLLSSHWVGSVSLPRLATSPAPTQLVTKVAISVDVNKDLELTVAAMDLATKQSTKVTLLGDETVLARDTVAQTTTEMARLFSSHRVPLDTTNLNGTTQPASATAALEDYAVNLRSMVEKKTLEIRLSDADQHELADKIDELLTWLHSENASSKDHETTADSTDESSGASDHNATVRRRLQMLRRLQWSIVAASAVAELRAVGD